MPQALEGDAHDDLQADAPLLSRLCLVPPGGVLPSVAMLTCPEGVAARGVIVAIAVVAGCQPPAHGPQPVTVRSAGSAAAARAESSGGVPADPPISWIPLAATEPGLGPAANEREQRLRLATDLMRLSCLGVSEQIRMSRLRYESYVAWETGPAGVASPDIYDVYDLNDCAAQLAEAAGTVPDSQKLTEVSSRYAASVTSLGQIINEADAYYDQGRHLQDGYARGIELHEQLRTGFQYHAPIDAVFQELFRTLRREADGLLLARLERNRSRFPLGLLVERARIRSDDLGELRGCLALSREGMVSCTQRDDFVTAAVRLQEAVDALQGALQEDDAVHQRAQQVDVSGFVEDARKLALLAESIVIWMRDSQMPGLMQIGSSEDPTKFRAAYRDVLTEYHFLKGDLGHL